MLKYEVSLNAYYKKSTLTKEEYVFCTISEKSYIKFKIKPVLMFKEKEGIAIIIEKIAEKYNFPYTGIGVMIILKFIQT